MSKDILKLSRISTFRFWSHDEENGDLECSFPTQIDFPKFCKCLNCKKTHDLHDGKMAAKKRRFLRQLVKTLNLKLRIKNCDHQHTIYHRGIALMNMGNVKSMKLAISDFNEVIETDNGCEDHLVASLFHRACCLRKLGDFNSAFSDFKRSLQIRPNYLQAIMELSGIFRNIESPQKKTVLNLLERTRINIESQTELSLPKVDEEKTDIKMFYLVLSRVYCRDGNFEKSMECVEKSMKYKRENCVCPYLFRSKTFFKMEKFKECYEDIDYSFETRRKPCESSGKHMSIFKSFSLRIKCLFKLIENNDEEEERKKNLRIIHELINRTFKFVKKPKLEGNGKDRLPCPCRFDNYSDILTFEIRYFREMKEFKKALKKVKRFNRIFSKKHFVTLCDVNKNAACNLEKYRIFRDYGKIELALEILRKRCRNGDLLCCLEGEVYCEKMERYKDLIWFINIRKAIYFGLMGFIRDCGNSGDVPKDKDEGGVDLTNAIGPSQRKVGLESLSVWKSKLDFLFGRAGEEVTVSSQLKFWISIVECEVALGNIYWKTNQIRKAISCFKRAMKYSSIRIVNYGSKQNIKKIKDVEEVKKEKNRITERKKVKKEIEEKLKQIESGELSQEKCLYCGEIAQCKKCAKCLKASYCCRDHQVLHWKIHRSECKTK